MKLRKLLAITVALAMLISLAPAPVTAREANITLEEAIQTAKGLFPATAQYPEFVSEFSASPQSSAWNLRWSSGEPSESEMSVHVDAQTGDVIHMYRWGQESGQPAAVSISRADAQVIADRWLKKILPEKSSRLQTLDSPALIPLSSNGYSTFQIQYQRMENGLPVLGDMARIEVNARTRDIDSFNLNWTDLPLAAPSKVVTASQASQAFQADDMLKMQYFSSRASSYSQDGPVRLIYRIDHPSNGTINALTGKPLTLKKGQNERYTNDMAMAFKQMAGDRSAAEKEECLAPSLTPQEITELEKQADIITKEEAAAKIKQWVEIPRQAVLNQASLNRDWQNKDVRVWNLNWSKDSTDGEYFNMRARVDANTGRIYSFNSYSGAKADAGILTKDQAIALAQDFISKIEPQLSTEVKINLSEAWDVKPLAREKLPAQWTVAFTRQVNGTPFPNDGMQVTVSGMTSQIISYDLTWTKQAFPMINKAMGSSEAYQVFLGLAPMTLCYSPITASGNTSEFLLVYKPQTTNELSEFAMLDAISGTALDSIGDPLDKKPAPRTFNDVAGHYAEKEIRAIGQAGLMNEYGQQFKPEETITNNVFLRAVLGACNGVWSIVDIENDKVISQCLERGWITEKVNPQADLTRQLLTEVAIRSMELDKAARYGSLYKNPFPKDQTIDESKLGYIALAHGMKLLHADGEFNAHEAVTRGEAAYTIVRSFKI